MNLINRAFQSLSNFKLFFLFFEWVKLIIRHLYQRYNYAKLQKLNKTHFCYFNLFVLFKHLGIVCILNSRALAFDNLQLTFANETFVFLGADVSEALPLFSRALALQEGVESVNFVSNPLQAGVNGLYKVDVHED